MGLLRAALTPFNVAVMGIAALLVAFCAATLISSMKWRSVTAGWDRSIGTREQIMERYPTSGPNAAALELERLAVELEVDLVPRSARERRQQVELPARRLIAARNRRFGSYLDGEIARPTHEPAPPPEEITAWLRERREALGSVRAALVAGAPDWGIDVERPFSTSLPNLMGMLDLNRVLLVDALLAVSEGDPRRAAASLEASWNLSESLRRHPLMIVQLVSTTFLRLEAGVLRKLDDVPQPWVERLDPRPFRESFLASLQFEGWSWTTIPWGQVYSGNLTGAIGRAAGQISAPYTRFCVADVSEDYRRRLDALLRVEKLCGADLKAQGADLAIHVPKWNKIGGMLVPNFTNAVERLARLELDLELTARIVELEQIRERQGAWPDALPGSTDSTACPDARWRYAAAADGSMEIALESSLEWYERSARVLPTEHVH